MPNMTSLASLLVVATPLYFAVAWILAGSSRIAYVGFQMGIGLSLVLINGPKPALELAPALDRFLGVVIGTVVFGIIDLVVWPVFARSAIRRKLVEAMRQMAVLQRASAARDEPAVQREAITIYRTLTDSVALQDGLQLEPEVRETDAAERDQALRLTSSLQDTFLYLLAVWRHRQSLDEAAPGEAAALATLDQQSAQRLTALAEGTPCPSLSSASVEAIAETSSSPRVRELAVVYRGLLESLGRLPTKATTEEHG
jgi:multidrug resistance protein MdtO